MIDIVDIKGLKYPDEFMIRFFFKEALFEEPGAVMELGCGNGNNLMLFNQYGWDVLGIDISTEAIENADYNFEKYGLNDTSKTFVKKDLNDGILPLDVDGNYEVILIPNVANYLPRASFVNCLCDIRKLIAPGGRFFLKTRTFGDYRYKRGKEAERNAYIMDTNETGEQGAMNLFYHEYELMDLLREHLNPEMESINIFRSQFDNIQKGVLVRNCDVIIWGII